MSIEHTETCIFISGAPLATEHRARATSTTCTTAGNCIGPMRMPNWKDAAETWQLPLADKKKFCGDACTYGWERKDEDVEPVAYNAMHKTCGNKCCTKWASMGVFEP